MKKIALLILPVLAAAFVMSCSDYDNDPISISNGTASETGPGTGTLTNPLPPGYEKPNEGDFTVEKMLVNIGTNVIAKNVHEFALQTSILSNRLARYCEDLDSGVETPATEKIAKDQWEATMLAYHTIDVAPVGPLSAAGRYLGDHIYGWPLLDPCGIDQETAKLAAGNPTKQLLVSLKGLGALEYMLFDKTYGSSCRKILNPLAFEWAKKETLTKKQERCKYAQYITQDLVDKAAQLDRAWSPTQGNYTKTLIDNTQFKSAKAAVNALTDSMFNLEKLKDEKLAIPMGVSEKCLNADRKCSDLAEHAWSGLAIRAVAAEVAGFKQIFWGSTNTKVRAFGFDDYLVSVGHGDIPLEIETYLNTALQQAPLADAQGSLQEQIANSNTHLCLDDTQNSPLCLVFKNVRNTMTSMKTELLLILALEAPPLFQGDND